MGHYYDRRDVGVKYTDGKWTEWFFDFIFSNMGGWLGLLICFILGVYAVAVGKTVLFDELFASAVFGVPLVTLAGGAVGATIGTIVSFMTRRGGPVTAWSRKVANKGREHLEMGEIDKAAAVADKVLRGGAAGFPGGYQLRGDIYLKKGDVDRAVEEYTKAIKLKPDWAGGYCDRGGAYLIKGDYNKALEDFDEAIRHRGLRFMGYIYRGKTYSIKGEFDKAVADYNEALEMNPYYLYGYYCRGVIYKELGEIDKAIANYSEAIRREPLDGFCYGCRGDAYTVKGEYDKAVADFSEAIRFGPNRAKWHFSRGVAHENIGDINSAAADFNAVIRMEPHSEEAASARDAIKKLGAYNSDFDDNPAYAKTQSARKSTARADLDEFLVNMRKYRNENKIWG